MSQFIYGINPVVFLKQAIKIVLMDNQQQFREEKKQESQQQLETLKQNLGIDIVLD